VVEEFYYSQPYKKSATFISFIIYYKLKLCQYQQKDGRVARAEDADRRMRWKRSN